MASDLRHVRDFHPLHAVVEVATPNQSVHLRVRTVVNALESATDKRRTFRLRHLAGEDCGSAVLESNCHPAIASMPRCVVGIWHPLEREEKQVTVVVSVGGSVLGERRVGHVCPSGNLRDIALAAAVVNADPPAAFRIAEYHEIESGIPAVQNVRRSFRRRVECVCLASSLRIYDAGSSTSLRNECRAARRVYRTAFQDNRPAFVCKMHPAEVAVDVRRFATPYGERHDEVTLVDILDLAYHADERPGIDNLARFNSGKVRKSPGAVVARPPAVVNIVVDGYVECVRESVQCTFDMPTDRIIDNLKAVTYDVRPSRHSHTHRHKRSGENGFQSAMCSAVHYFSTSPF